MILRLAQRFDIVESKRKFLEVLKIEQVSRIYFVPFEKIQIVHREYTNGRVIVDVNAYMLYSNSLVLFS